MRPMFYLIGTKDKRWGDPTFGIVVFSQDTEEDLRHKMANSLHQGWQLMVQVLDWTELRIFTYHRSRPAIAPADLRQITLELMVKLGHIRIDIHDIIVREDTKKFRYGHLEVQGEQGIYWRLKEEAEGQELMFSGSDDYIYDDPHTLLFLYMRGKLDIEEHGVRKVEFRADPTIKYELTLSEEHLWLKACVDWEVLMEGIMK